jgi:hypothetical protein
VLKVGVRRWSSCSFKRRELVRKELKRGKKERRG